MRGERRIVVVDDDPWSRRIVQRLLGQRGHVVEVAVDVPDARARLADLAGVGLVLLDINLPGGSGEVLLDELRVRAPRLPVLAVTASAMAGDRERLLRRGFTAYFSKPIDVRTFGATVERYLAGGADLTAQGLP